MCTLREVIEGSSANSSLPRVMSGVCHVQEYLLNSELRPSELVSLWTSSLLRQSLALVVLCWTRIEGMGVEREHQTVKVSGKCFSHALCSQMGN